MGIPLAPLQFFRFTNLPTSVFFSFATFVSYYPGIIMRPGLFAAATAALAGSVAGQVVKRQSGSLPTIETRGNAFYTAGGERSTSVVLLTNLEVPLRQKTLCSTPRL